jgi:hypothetical protein
VWWVGAAALEKPAAGLKNLNVRRGTAQWRLRDTTPFRGEFKCAVKWRADQPATPFRRNRLRRRNAVGGAGFAVPVKSSGGRCSVPDLGRGNATG